MKSLRYLLALLLAAVGLRAADKKPDFDPSVVLKIIIRADGAILVDGVSTKLSEVPAKLTALSEKKEWFGSTARIPKASRRRIRWKS